MNIGMCSYDLKNNYRITQVTMNQLFPSSNVYGSRFLSNTIKTTFKWIAFSAVALSLSSQVTLADIGATHTTLVSEFASFNTPGVVDGRVEAIAIDGDIVFVGGTFTQIHDPLSDEIIDQPYLFAYSKSSGNIIRTSIRF